MPELTATTVPIAAQPKPLCNAYLVERGVSLDLLLPVPERDAAEWGGDAYEDETEEWMHDAARLLAKQDGANPDDEAVRWHYYYKALGMRYPGIGEGGSERGADMGRTSRNEEPENGTVRVYYLPLWDGGYDPGGAYWGGGQDIYVGTDGGGFFKTCRAASRAEAIETMEIEREWLMFPDGNDEK